MADPQGIATFPGVKQVVSCAAARTHGISPNVYQLRIAPQSPGTIPDTGTLTLHYGRTKIELAECLVDEGTIDLTEGGQVMSFTVLDKRWRWSFGEISGKYNVRDKAGNIVMQNPAQQAAGALPAGDGLGGAGFAGLVAAAAGAAINAQAGNNAVTNSERTPQELAKLCLAAMHEQDIDVADLPNKARPEVHWEHDNPAEALQELAESLGCRVVLELSGKVAIRRLGVGAELPRTDEATQYNEVLNPPNQPDSIKAVAARTRIQADFLLEAVGLDLDGTVKPIDDLSYKPAGGWSAVDLTGIGNGFNNVRLQPNNLPADAGLVLARQTVFRWYRVKTPYKLPGRGGLLTTLRHILPLETEQVDTVVENGATKNRPAVIFGVWFDWSDAAGLANQATTLANGALPPPLDNDKPDKSVVTIPWTLEQETGLIKFDGYLFKNDTPAANPQQLTPGEAFLILRTAVPFRVPETGQFHRVTREKKLGGRNKTGPKVLKREIACTIEPIYDANTYALKNITTNQQAVNKELDHYISEEQRQMTDAKRPQTATYAGLFPINLDGAIQLVRWQTGPQGATTQAGRNHDTAAADVVPFALRRQTQQIRKLVRGAAAVAALAAQQAGTP